MEYFGLPSSLTLASETAKSLPPPLRTEKTKYFQCLGWSHIMFFLCTVFYTYKCIRIQYISVGDKDQTLSNTTLTPQAELVKTNLDIDFCNKIHHIILGFGKNPVTSS